MRGCLTFLLLVAVLVGALVSFGGPPVAGGAVSAALVLAGFDGADTTVDVVADPPLELVTLHADSVRVRSRDARFGSVEAGALDVTVEDVDLGTRAFARIEGTLDDVTLRATGGPDPAGTPEVRLRMVRLSGAAEATTAHLTLAASEVERLAAAAIESTSGQRPSRVALAAPDHLSFTVGGIDVGGRLLVDAAGGLVLRPDVDILPEIDVLRPGDVVPLRLRSLEIAGEDLVLIGTVRLADL